MTDARLERRFDAEMEEIYHGAKRIGYNVTRFLAMVREHGGLATAHRLLSTDQVHDGFAELYLLGRKDLTVEWLVLRPEFQPLFNEAELSRARARLGGDGR